MKHSNKKKEEAEALEESKLIEQVKKRENKKTYVKKDFTMLQKNFLNQLQNQLQIQVQSYLRRVNKTRINWETE